ncbi:putative protease Do-like 14, partial [Gastrolobium bilobum]|uniref:putative protease Do-like 14 n=1 Tax=Gastrolobium bilobum TaxID=150636 RepID=UPI002AB2F671
MNISEETSGAVGDRSSSSDYFGRHTIANAAAKVGPSVVTIVVSQDLNGITTKRSIGSGTIIDKDGTILTCAHVVVDFQGTRSFYKGKVEVTLQDGRTFQGKVVNADMHSDIAIVKINSETPLPEAKLGSSSTLRPEDLVIAMGCTHSLQNTVTLGIVSCVDRKSSDLGFNGTPREYLQTDCAINEGNSGGPLVNMDGEVIGVNLMKMMVADGLSFSVPIDSVPKIIEHFKKNGRVVQPWIGLKGHDLNEMINALLQKIDASFPNMDKGIFVSSATPGSPSDYSGFRPGDVVVEFDGKPVENMNV